MQGDVRDARSHLAAVDAAIQETGRLDVLVANAGVHDGGIGLDSEPGELLECLRVVLDVDVIGYALAAQAAAPALRASRGHVVMTLSDASFLVGQQGAGLAYTAAKHAAFGLLGWLARALAPEVRVNGIAPGGVVTDLRAVGWRRGWSSHLRRRCREDANRPRTQPARDDAHGGRGRRVLPVDRVRPCPRADRSGHSTRRWTHGPLRPRRSLELGDASIDAGRAALRPEADRRYPDRGGRRRRRRGAGWRSPTCPTVRGPTPTLGVPNCCGSAIRSRPVVNSAMKPLGSWK